MSANVLYDKLQTGSPLFGVGNMYPAPGILEGMCKGYDFAWLDGQHGQHDYQSLLHANQAAEGQNIGTVMRIATSDPLQMGYYADLAPSAIMMPMVNTAHQAEEIVQGLCFPPRGSRSYGGRRVIDLYGREYHREVPLLVIAQIETLEAVDNAEAIASVDGIDGLFYGPDDMRCQLDLPMDTSALEHDKMRAGAERTGQAALNSGKFAGSVTPSTEAIQLYHDFGYRLFVVGGDITFLRGAAAEKLNEIRQWTGGEDGSGGSQGIYG